MNDISANILPVDNAVKIFTDEGISTRLKINVDRN